MKTSVEDKLDRLIELMEKQSKSLLTLEEAGERLNIGKNKMGEIASRDSFPKVMNGNRVLVIASELDDWIMAHKGGCLWIFGSMLLKIDTLQMECCF